MRIKFVFYILVDISSLNSANNYSSDYKLISSFLYIL